MSRTIVFFVYFWITVSLSSPLALMLWILDSAGFHRTREITGMFVRFWARSLLWIMGVRVDAIGLDRIPEERSVCFVANHQGDVDIVVILAYMPRCVGFITKSQAAWMPFLNIWIFALGGVFINRGKVRKAHGSIERGVRRIRSGGAMAIFPEGTRSRGPRVGPFKNGSFKLATRSGSVLVPLSIQGTYKVWEERHRIVPAEVSLAVSEPIYTGDLSGEDKKKLPELVRQRILEGMRTASNP